jgi:hypothetical protein
MQFGKSAENLDLDQLNLGLKDLERTVAAGEAEQEKVYPVYSWLMQKINQ